MSDLRNLQDDNLNNLPNVGKILKTKLLEVNIDTPLKLREIGSKEAFLRIRVNDPTACLHMLYGLEGAVLGIPDSRLDDETKTDLKAFFRSL